jgi:hypothetical protein
MTRWRIMALLVEAMARHQYVRAAMVRPEGATMAEVCEVMDEACMEPVTTDTWTAGEGTLMWWTYWMHGAASLLSIGEP